MTTDTVKDVRSIGSGCGSPAAVSDGGNSNAGSSPLAPPIPLVNVGQHGPLPNILRRPQRPFQVGPGSPWRREWQAKARLEVRRPLVAAAREGGTGGRRSRLAAREDVMAAR